jgi:hypothetical protein
VQEDGISWPDQQFILAFHNFSGFRPPGWYLTHYPMLLPEKLAAGVGGLLRLSEVSDPSSHS